MRFYHEEGKIFLVIHEHGMDWLHDITEDIMPVVDEYLDHKLELKHEKRKCMSCNGSGRYDSHGYPPCGACDGKGYHEGRE